MEYESPITDMANVKVFKKWVKLQGQGHKVKNYGTIRKVLIGGNTHMKYESPITYHSKCMANDQVFEQEAHGPHRSPE
jgi:hypothetical protein